MEKLNLVKSAAESKDADAFGQALATVTERESLVSIFNKVLLEDWHDAHEDIVFELGLIGHPSSTESIEMAATIPFQYLEEWGNLHEFQRKCAYALARIGTEESRNALKKLSESSDSYLQEYGQEGLRYWPLKKA